MRTVLISGAGVAGPTLAYWLARAGLQPTVVERSAGQRSSGNPVDVRGAALPVVERMGVVEALRANATRATALRFVDRDGHLGRRMSMGSRGKDEVEIPRADLARVLFEAARHDAEFVYGDSIAAIGQDAGGVDVTFDSGGQRRFDLVVGADGLHSNVRRLAFGPETDFVRYLGIYVATTALGEPAEQAHDILLHNRPGRLVSIHPARGTALVAFIFRHATVTDFDYRDAGQHRRILADAYRDDDGWRVPELVRKAGHADDLYFDAVSKVVLPSWSRGRIVLLGDAAASVSLLGDGSSMAIAGAHTLAGSLANKDHREAFKAYEVEHRRRTDPRRRGAGLAAAMLVPKSRAGIVARNAAARLLPAGR
ncbi:MAG TPA: FAD-dependent monooxygenase [Actinoplanes sp.]|jgi:2-polyprenyl-6-methoxyphenol hydroxylase-like FAD-dependent oxidoreductase